MRLKRKKPGPTIDLKEGMKERAMVQDTEVEEGEEYCPRPYMEGEKDFCSSEEEAGCIKIFLCPEEGIGILRETCHRFLCYSFCYY